MAKLNPIDHLPDQMKRYLSIPMKLFTFWVIGSIVFLLILFIFNQPDQRLSDGMNHFDDDQYMEKIEETQASSSALIRELSISGRDDFKIKYKYKGVRVYHNDYPTLKLVREADKTKLKGEGVSFRLKNKADGKVNLYDQLDQLVYKAKQKGNEYHLSDPQGALIYRLKMKQDSFNLYNHETRIMKGKSKGGYVNVKDPSGQRILKIKDSDLLEAGLLSFPIDPPYRILLLAHYGDFDDQ